MGREFDGDMHKEFTDLDRNSIRFVGNRFIVFKPVASTTQAMIYSGNVTQ